MTRRNGIALIIAAFCVVGGGALYIWRRVTPNHVEGAMTAHGNLLGSWTVALDSCVSGQRKRYRGVELFGEGEQKLSLLFVEPVGTEPTLTISVPNLHRVARFAPGDCKTLEGHLAQHDSAVDRPFEIDGPIQNVEGDVVIDCGPPDGHITGTVTFSNCH